MAAGCARGDSRIDLVQSMCICGNYANTAETQYKRETGGGGDERAFHAALQIIYFQMRSEREKYLTAECFEPALGQ